MTPEIWGQARRPIIRRRIRRADETDFSGTREQAARQRALAAELDRVGGALRAGSRPASVRGAMANAACEPSNIGEPDGLGNFSQRAGNCVARGCRVPLAALATPVAAAEPVARYLCFYWRDSGFSPGDDFADHALSS